jgi:hypothetical protein
MCPVGFLFTFLLLAYNGNTFGSYGQIILYSVPRFILLYQNKDKKHQLEKMNKSLVCPCEGSGKKKTVLPDRSALSCVWGYGPKFRPLGYFFFGVSSVVCGLLSGGFD